MIARHIGSQDGGSVYDKSMTATINADVQLFLTLIGLAVFSRRMHRLGSSKCKESFPFPAGAKAT
jgi:hypothetical protein